MNINTRYLDAVFILSSNIRRPVYTGVPYRIGLSKFELIM